MRNCRSVFICIALTILFSLPSVLKLPVMLPLLDADVRAKAPVAVEEIRKKGIWMVNAKLKSITKQDGKVCFDFEHRYTGRDWGLGIRDWGIGKTKKSRLPNPEPETITACV